MKNARKCAKNAITHCFIRRMTSTTKRAENAIGARTNKVTMANTAMVTDKGATEEVEGRVATRGGNFVLEYEVFARFYFTVDQALAPLDYRGKMFAPEYEHHMKKTKIKLYIQTLTCCIHLRC